MQKTLLFSLATVLVMSFASHPCLAQLTLRPDENNSDVTITGEAADKAEVSASFPTLQGELGLNDSDFAVLVPKIAKVDNLIGLIGPIGLRNRPVQGNQGYSAATGGRLGPGYGPIPWRQDPRISPIEYARRDLDEILKDPNAPASAIASKLESYRSVKAKFEADLHVAREDLRAHLTVRQEAVMVMHRLLD
jgi:hypothetical protein